MPEVPILQIIQAEPYSFKSIKNHLHHEHNKNKESVQKQHEKIACYFVALGITRIPKALGIRVAMLRGSLFARPRLRYHSIESGSASLRHPLRSADARQ